MSDAQAVQTILGAAAVAVLLSVQSWIARRRAEDRHAITNAKVDTVEETVNGNFARALRRIDQLAEALTAHGIDVPPAPTGEEA